MIGKSLLIAIPLMVAAVQARAQDPAAFVTGIFKNFHSVAIYTQSSALHGSSALDGGGSRCVVLDMCGGGIEFLIDLDTLEGGHVELGVGASYLRGFQLKDSTLDLHASLRSFPTLSGYFAGANVLGVADISGYLGLSFGLSELWNGQVYDSAGTEITLKAQTFDYGASAGLHWDLGPVGGPFLEIGYKRRLFTSLDWGDDTVPVNYPRSLDLSGWNLQVGWQFRLRQDPKPTPPPALEGRWRLLRVDGDTLPFAASQSLDPNFASVSRRTQWLDGILEFTGTERYDLTLLTRVETLNGADVVALDSIIRVWNSGTYTEGKTTLTLRPWPATRPGQQPAPPPLPQLTATRAQKHIILDYNGHLLTFARY
jgi:hypothetical protein